MKKIFKFLGCLSLFFVVIISIFFIYLSNYYHASTNAYDLVYNSSSDDITILADDSGISFIPSNPTCGFIFYPGAKVEAESYAPLMNALAKDNILCVIVKMPYNLAFFNINGADTILAKYPDISNWYIGGHSLGGAMAASYLGENQEKYDGLILLASYSTYDFSDTDIDVLSIYGSEDKVLSLDSYNKYMINLPECYTEYIIDGGCHAYFGDYGFQKGDGEPRISTQSQVDQTTAVISEFIY